MAKTLKQILEVYAPKSKDEKKFMDKHIVAKSKLDDRGTQDDKLFNATNIKTVSRETEHGYNPGNDEKVYEEATKDLHPMALHVKDVGNGKYKVHAVGKHLSDGIKVGGKPLSDTELDDAEEMGAKIKMIEEVEQLTEDEELTQLLNTIYENLSDENKEIFEQILEEDPDQMIEFLEQLELQDGE